MLFIRKLSDTIIPNTEASGRFCQRSSKNILTLLCIDELETLRYFQIGIAFWKLDMSHAHIHRFFN